MTTFGYFITRALTDAEISELDGKVRGLGAEFSPNMVQGSPIIPGEPPSAPPSAPSGGNLLNGWVAYGGAEIRWADGVPIEARLVSDHNNRADVPLTFWSDVTQYANQDQWAPFAYIAFLESRYDTNADVVDTNAEHSRGYFQVNGVHAEYDNATMFDGRENVKAAQAIYDDQGYGAWYNSAKLLGLI